MMKKDLEKLIDVLPVSPGILNQEKYLKYAVLVPLVLINEAYYLLFEVRQESIGHGGEICFPGGKIDVGETAEAAVLRETVEELCIDKSQINLIGRMDTLVTTLGITIEVFVGIIDIERIMDVQPNFAEVKKAFVLPLTYFEETIPETHHIRLEVQPSFVKDDETEHVLLPSKVLGLPDRYHQPWGHRLLPVYVYKTEEGALWGITAEIVREFIRILAL